LEAVDGNLGAGREVIGPILALCRLAEGGELDLRPPPLAHLEGAGQVQDGTGRRDRVELLGLLPADRLGAAAGVGDREPEPWLAVPLSPQLTVADGVGAGDALAVLQLAQRHPLRRARLAGLTP